MITGLVKDSGAEEPVATTDSGTVADSTSVQETVPAKGTPGPGIVLSILAIKQFLFIKKEIRTNYQEGEFPSRLFFVKSNVAPAHPIAAELRGMTCRRLTIQFLFKI